MAYDNNWVIWVFLFMKGSLIWSIQRYSSLFILAYFVYFVFYLLKATDSYHEWSLFIASFEMRAATSLTALLIILHAYIGLWTVGTDYLTKRTLGFLKKGLSNQANLIRGIYYFIFIFSGLLYLGVILYIIWTI